MVVSGYDECDFEFVKIFGFLVKEVVKGGNIEEVVYIGDGEYVNLDFLNGFNKQEVIEKVIVWLEEMKNGEKKVMYCLCDWFFSCQCYWGELILVIYWEDGILMVVLEEELLLILLKMDEIKLSGIGELLFVNIKDWVEVIDFQIGKKGRREMNIML